MKKYENIKVEIIKEPSMDVITTSGRVTFDEVDKNIWETSYNTGS